MPHDVAFLPSLAPLLDAIADARGWAIGAVALLSMPDLKVVVVSGAMGKVEFP